MILLIINLNFQATLSDDTFRRHLMNKELKSILPLFEKSMLLFNNPLNSLNEHIKEYLCEASNIFGAKEAFLRIIHFPENKIPPLFFSNKNSEKSITPSTLDTINNLLPFIDYKSLSDSQIYKQANQNFKNYKNDITILKDIFSKTDTLCGLTIFSNTMPLKENLIKNTLQTNPLTQGPKKINYPVAHLFFKFDSSIYDEKLKKHNNSMLKIIDFLSISLENKIKLQITDDAKKRYRMFLDQSKDTIWAADLNFKFIYMSPAVLPLRGYTAQEAIEQPVNEMFVPESVQKIYTIYTQAREMLATNPDNLGWPEGIEVIAKCKDGSTIWNEVTAQFTRNNQGEVVGFVGISRDIDRRKKIEAQLEYKRKFENLITKFAIDFINIPISKIDQKISQALKEIGEFQSCDSSWLFITNDNGQTMSLINQWLAPETIDEIDLWQDIDTTDFSWFAQKLFSTRLIALNSISELPDHASPLKGLLIKRGVKSFIATPVIINNQIAGFVGMDHKNHCVRWSEDIKTILKITGQIFSNLLSRKLYEEELNSHRNNLEELVKNRTIELQQSNEQLISEIEIRKKVETDLVKSELLFKSIFDNSIDCIMVVNADLKLIFENRAAVELSKKRQLSFRENNLSKSSDELLSFQKKWISHIKKAFDTGIPLRREDAIILKGQEIIIEATFSPIKDTLGNIFSVGIIYRDITEKKDSERKLQTSEKLDSLGLLAGGIAHDFNNYLTVIMASSTLAEAKISKTFPNDHPLIKPIKTITKSARNASRLATQLLTLSKGGAPIKKKIDIHKLIHEAIEINIRSNDNIKTEFNFSTMVKPFNADKDQISQILANLVINAKQAIVGKGQITIETKLLENYQLDCKSYKDDYIYITVRDSGHGIPKEQLENIFDPFFTTKKTGSGIGLTIINSIIKKHDGYLNVSSKINVGTCFEIYLPALVPKTEIIFSKKSEKNNKMHKRILFMDDVKEIRETMKEILKSLGHQIDLACHGEEAITKYKQVIDKQKPFDVIILDLTIPNGMGGIETLIAIKKINPQVCAIVSSGYAHDPVMSNFENYGFKGKLLKPYQLNDIQNLFKRLFEQD